MVLIRIMTMTDIYLAKDYLNHLMFVMDANQEAVVEKKDGPIMQEKLTIHIKKLKAKLEKALI